MKKFFALFAVAIIAVGILAGCSSSNTSSDNSTSTENDPNKITIVATLFPQYDFARQIAGDKANIELILPPGVESHTFDPSPSDIITYIMLMSFYIQALIWKHGQITSLNHCLILYMY